MVNGRTIGFLGFPGTGKSTYLGALWQVIQDSQDANISEIDFTGDRSYLQELGENVAAALPLQRTHVSSENGMLLKVEIANIGDVLLDIPDLAGEAAQRLVEDRVWHERMADVLGEAAGILLFIHPGDLRLPVRTSFVLGIAAEIGANSDPTLGAETSSNVPPSRPQSGRFAAHDASTASRLIDLLENVLHSYSGTKPLRTALMITAWDTVEANCTPTEWLHKNLPALASFFGANAKDASVSVFGVSAQGGPLSNREDLLKQGNVLKRSYAVNEDGASVPLAEPLLWVLGN